MKKYNVRTLVICIGLLLTPSLLAQGKENVDKLKRELTLEKEYDPTIGDAPKINILPQIDSRELRKVTINYSNFSRSYETPRTLTIVPLERFQTKMDFKKQFAYFNLGAGTRGNINGDCGIVPINNRKTFWSFYGTHRSTNSKVYPEHINETLKGDLKINDNLFGTDFRTEFDPVLLTINAVYGFNNFNYPGAVLLSYGSGSYIPKLYDKEKTKDKRFFFQTNLSSLEGYPLIYRVGFNFGRIDRQIKLSSLGDGIEENRFGATASIGFPVRGDSKFLVDANINYYTYDLKAIKDSIPYDERKEYHIDDHFEGTLSPHFDFTGGVWRLSLGANLFAISGDDKKFGISPLILGEVAFSNRSKAYMHIDGGLESNDLYSLSRHYRYLYPFYRGLPTRVLLDATLGFKFGIGDMARLNIFGGYRIAKNELFYSKKMNVMERPDLSISLPSSELFGQKFFLYTPVLDLLQADTNCMKLGAEFNFNLREEIHLALHGTYYKWDMKNNEKVENPYGKPNFELGVIGKFRLMEKLNLNLGYLLLANRKGLYAPIYSSTYIYTAPEIKEKDYHELNAEINYRLFSSLSVYLRADNLLFRKSQEYYLGFPTQGFRFLGGVNLKF